MLRLKQNIERARASKNHAYIVNRQRENRLSEMGKSMYDKRQTVLQKLSEIEIKLENKGIKYAFESETSSQKIRQFVKEKRESRFQLRRELSRLRADSCRENRTLAEMQRKLLVSQLL